MDCSAKLTGLSVFGSKPWSNLLLLATFICLICLCVSGEDQQSRREEVFFVQPGGGTLNVDLKVGKYECVFTYAAQGGTNEEWQISLELLDRGTAVMCNVERPKTSYLFFEKFSMDLKGPQVSISDVDLKDSQRDGKSLNPEEYTKTKTSVTSVEGKFKNHLEKVAVYSPLATRDDL